jgi:hypothetical protein
MPKKDKKLKKGKKSKKDVNSNKNTINIKIDNTKKARGGRMQQPKKPAYNPPPINPYTQQSAPMISNRPNTYTEKQSLGTQTSSDTTLFSSHTPAPTSSITKPTTTPIATSTSYLDTSTPYRTLYDLSTVHGAHSSITDEGYGSKHSTTSDAGDKTWGSIKSEPSIKSEDIPNVFADPNPANNPFFGNTVPITEEGTFNSIINNDESSLPSMIPITSETPQRYEDEAGRERKEKERLKNQKDYLDRKALVDEIRMYEPGFTPRQDIGKKKLKEILDLVKQTTEITKQKR